MTPFISTYLDLVRFGAAMVVMLDHVWPPLAPNLPLPWPGHQAVVVFFVLSGFVIAYVTDGREKTLSDYVTRRIARVWSVAIPALILSALVVILVRLTTIADEGVPPDNFVKTVQHFAINAVFFGQVWFLDISPPLNGPFWSLNYEVWYYAIFGAWTYLHGYWRGITVIVLAVVCGPKILLMFPCWLAGVYLYRHMPTLSPKTAMMLFGTTVAAYLVLFQTDVAKMIQVHMTMRWPTAMAYLGGSNKFVGDYLLALVVAINFGAVGSLGKYGAELTYMRKPMRVVAAYTFSIYLYHVPLMELMWDGFKWHSYLVVFPLATGIVLLGHITERKLPWVRASVSAIVAHIGVLLLRCVRAREDCK